MSKNYIAPIYKLDGFHCPHCGTYAMQKWNQLIDSMGVHVVYAKDLFIAICSRCKEHSVWQDQRMIYPDDSGIESPNQDLNEDIKKDYLEAASIVHKSPRGSCALLRLILDKLCRELCEKSGNKAGKLHENISHLVNEGMPKEIEQALHIVRVIGNEAVHIGEMNLKDDKETAVKLFYLINRIATNRITDVKEHEVMFNNLPSDKLKGIKIKNETNN